MKDNKQLEALMIPPKYFDVTYSINPFMRPETASGRVNQRKAMRQWERLAETTDSLGVRIRIMAPVKGLPDIVFTANGALVAGNTALIARFAKPQRQQESKHFRHWFRRNGYRTVDACCNFEGTGDAINFGSKILLGHGIRSDYRIHEQIERVAHRPTVSVPLQTQMYYHLDTAMLVLDETTVMVYTPALKPEGLTNLNLNVENVYTVGTGEAAALGLNGIAIGKDLILVPEAEKIAEKAEELGFTVHTVDLSEFRKSGGGPWCLTLFI